VAQICAHSVAIARRHLNISESVAAEHETTQHLSEAVWRMAEIVVEAKE
jgi:hypothetical protein